MADPAVTDKPRTWIRISGPGEFRGEGNWHEVRGEAMERDFAACKVNGYLPVAWECEAPDVRDGAGRFPNVVLGTDTMTHRLGVAVPCPGHDDNSVKYAHKQLLSIVAHLESSNDA